MSAFLKVTEKVDRFDRGIEHHLDAPANADMKASPKNSLTGLEHFHEFDKNILISDGQEHQILDEALAYKTYAEGLAEGRLQALSEAKTQQAEFRELVQNLDQAIQDLSRDIEAGHSLVLTQILQTVLPALATERQMAEIKSFILQISAPALHGCVTIFSPANLQTRLADIIQELSVNAAPESLHFKLEASPNIQGAQIRAKWDGGGGVLDIESAVKQCLSILQNNSEHENNNPIGDENGKA